MKEILVEKVKLNEEEKEALERIRSYLKSTKLPDSILFTSTFETKKLTDKLFILKMNIKDVQTDINFLLTRLGA